MRQAVCEEKARHAHCGTEFLDVLVAALVVWPSVVCDGLTTGCLLTRVTDMLVSDYLDDHVQASSTLGQPSYVSCESPSVFVARYSGKPAQYARG